MHGSAQKAFIRISSATAPGRPQRLSSSAAAQTRAFSARGRRRTTCAAWACEQSNAADSARSMPGQGVGTVLGLRGGSGTKATVAAVTGSCTASGGRGTGGLG